MQEIDRKRAAVDDCKAKGSSENPFLMLGTDLMVAVATYLEPKETLTFLTVPLCKEWRFSYTADQELWRTICCSEPFCADMTDYSASIEAASAQGESRKDTDENPLNSLDDYKDALQRSNILVGEYRLVYTSFVRCMKYLEQVRNNGQTGLNNAAIPGQVDRVKSNEIKFPTFGVTKSLKKFLHRNHDREALKSVIKKGSTDDIPMTPIGVTTDGREIHVSIPLPPLALILSSCLSHLRICIDCIHSPITFCLCHFRRIHSLRRATKKTIVRSPNMLNP